MRSALLLLLARAAHAHPEYVKLLPNGANVPGVAAVGHTDPDGGRELNFFGINFNNAGIMWTPYLCANDSDLDGKTNGEELGDPCCTWDGSSPPLCATHLSNPGDPLSTTTRIYNCSIPYQPCDGVTASPSPAPATLGGSMSEGEQLAAGGFLSLMAVLGLALVIRGRSHLRGLWWVRTKGEPGEGGEYGMMNGVEQGASHEEAPPVGSRGAAWLVG